MTAEQKEELKECMAEFENFSGAGELDDQTLEEITQNLSDDDFEEIKEAFNLLTGFYGGML